MTKALCVRREHALVEVIESETEARRRFYESNQIGNVIPDGHLPSLELNSIGAFAIVHGLEFSPFRKAALTFNLAARSPDRFDKLTLRRNTARVLSSSHAVAVDGLKSIGAEMLAASADLGEVLARVDPARVNPAVIALDFFLLSTTLRFDPSWRVIKILFFSDLQTLAP